VKILDCESVDSTYKSLEKILGIPTEEIKAFLAEFDMGNYYETHPDYYHTGDKLLVTMIKRKYDISYDFDITYWFHLTRAAKFFDFKEGILPLGEAINSIWDFLFSLLEGNFKRKDWIHFRRDLESNNLRGHYAHLYNLKLREPSLWGPYAMLVKHVAFIPELIGNHDYLKGPEIVEDICFTFEEIHGYNLIKKYIDNTQACIVKFKSDVCKPSYIGSALYYLYRAHRNEGISVYCNDCFDGGGRKVPGEDILKIEFVDYPVS